MFPHNASIRQSDDPIRHSCNDGVMSNDRSRCAQFPIYPIQRLEDCNPCLHIQRAGWLITQEDIGTFNDGTRDGNPLLLPAGKLCGKVIKSTGQSHKCQCFLGWHETRNQVCHKGHVFTGGQAWDQVVELKYKSDVLSPIAGQRGIVRVDQIMIAEPHFPGGWIVQSSQDIQQRRFAASRSPQEHHEFTGIQIKVDPAQRKDINLANAVDLGQTACPKDRVLMVTGCKIGRDSGGLRLSDGSSPCNTRMFRREDDADSF